MSWAFILVYGPFAVIGVLLIAWACRLQEKDRKRYVPEGWGDEDCSPDSAIVILFIIGVVVLSPAIIAVARAVGNSLLPDHWAITAWATGIGTLVFLYACVYAPWEKYFKLPAQQGQGQVLGQ